MANDVERAGKISAIRFPKEQESRGLGILVQSLGRVELWPGGFKSEDSIIATVKTPGLNGVLDQLREAQVEFQIEILTGEMPTRAHELWGRLPGWQIPKQETATGLI